MPPSDPLVVLGVVVRPHGIHGDLRVKLHNPDSDLLFRSEKLLLRSARGTDEAQVTSARLHQRGVALLHLDGYATRDQAEALRSAEVCLARGDLPALSADEYYLVDLVGLQVVERDGSVAGEVERVQVYPTTSALRIVGERGVCEIPLIEPYLVRVEREAGRVLVDRLEDLDWERPRDTRGKRRGKRGS